MAAPKGVAFNPSGKGGFQDHPENRSDGRWSGAESLDFMLNKYSHFTREQLEAEFKRPGLTAVEHTALVNVVSMMKDSDRGLKTRTFFAERTQGKPRQQIDSNIRGADLPVINIQFAQGSDDNIQKSKEHIENESHDNDIEN